MAMGSAIYEMTKALTEEEKREADSEPPFSSLMDALDQRSNALEDLDDDDLALVKELSSFFDTEHVFGDNKNVEKDVARAREIIDELDLNVNFPILPYGETLLVNSVHHSLAMMKLLIEKGADVNVENEMMSECALDKILEDEDSGELSEEQKAMKALLLANGAKTTEERWIDIANGAKKRAAENNKENIG